MSRFLWLLTLLSMIWQAPAYAQEDFLSPEQAFKLTVVPQDDGHVNLNWEISDGYYLYRKQLAVTSEPADQVKDFVLPKGRLKQDEFFGISEVYDHKLEAQANAPGAQALTVTWQGCAQAGLCYAPQTQTIKLSNNALMRKPSEQNQSFSLSGPTDENLAQRFSTSSTGWILLVFFGFGLLLAFTPCVLPMLPILASLIVGSGASPRRGFFLALAFVLPMALTYALFGVAAALLGENLQALVQTPWALGSFALIFILLALAMFGLYELQLPAFLRDRLSNASARQHGGTLGGAMLMGIFSALLVGPCMTAPLAGALLYISSTGNAVVGGLTLLAMGLGMGVPLLLVGTLGARLLPRPGPWLERVKALFGLVLLGLAVYFIARILPPSIALGAWGAWVLVIAMSLGVLARHSQGIKRWLAAYPALLLGLWGGLMVIGAARGGQNPWQPLAAVEQKSSTEGPNPTAITKSDFSSTFTPVNSEAELNTQIKQAGERGQWTLVDVYASWCVACKAIEREVFGDARVQQALSDMHLLRIDVTENNAELKALMAAHQIFGPPTLLLIGPDGKERHAQRSIGELSADTFLTRLAQAQKKK